MSKHYAIDTGDGNQLTAGLSPQFYARRVAQELANERGETVYLYEQAVCRCDGDDTSACVFHGDAVIDAVPIAPEKR